MKPFLPPPLYTLFLFNKASNSIPTIEPASSESKYQYQFPTTAKTKIPPCGAISVQLNNIDNPPATAEPIAHEGITRSGSAAAYGIAPSVIKLNPKI